MICTHYQVGGMKQYNSYFKQTMKRQVEKFNFFLPLNIIKGKKDASGNTKMKIGGIASTYDKDSDGENLDPTGFDLSTFINKGTFNWNHTTNKDPLAIIGEPTSAVIKDGKLHVEGELYDDSEKAKSVYKLMQVFEKNSKTRRLGFSIEGKVLERDPENESIVKKAMITGCAVTPMPKNAKTFANIIKGEFTPEFVEEEIPEIEVKTKNIVEVIKGEYTTTVDEEGNVKVDMKKKTKKNKDEETEKSMSTTSAAAVIPESVEGDKKHKALSKAEIMERIFDDIPVITIEKANKVHQLIQTISNMKNNSTTNKSVTDEDISKAYKALGIDHIQKGEDNESEDEETSEETAEDVNETEETSETSEETTDETTEEAGETKPKKKTEIAKSVDPGDEDDEEDNEIAEKATAFCKSKMYDIKDKNTMIKLMIKKGYSNDLAEKVYAACSDITKGGRFDRLERMIEAGNANANKLIKSLGLIVKSQADEIAGLKKTVKTQISKAQEDIAELGAGLNIPQQRKSITKVVEKTFEKGEQDTVVLDGKETAVRTVSITQNKNEVLNILDNATFEKGEVDNEFANSMIAFETSGVIDRKVVNRLRAEKGIQLVK
jgi:hypothetical protein